jgi:hypothetical protein
MNGWRKCGKYTHNGIIFSHKGKWNDSVCRKIDGTRDVSEISQSEKDKYCMSPPYAESSPCKWMAEIYVSFCIIHVYFHLLEMIFKHSFWEQCSWWVTNQCYKGRTKITSTWLFCPGFTHLSIEHCPVIPAPNQWSRQLFEHRNFSEQTEFFYSNFWFSIFIPPGVTDSYSQLI